MLWTRSVLRSFSTTTPAMATKRSNVDSKGTSGRPVTLEDVMRPAVSVTPDTPTRAVLKILAENNIPGVPVVDTEGYLIGFVSDGHLLASALPKYMADKIGRAHV